MKKILFLFSAACLLMACNNQDEALNPDSQVNPDVSGEFTLISRTVIDSENTDVQLRSSSSNFPVRSLYEESKQMHTYFLHTGPDLNHYYGHEFASSLTLNGQNYRYDWQRFQYFDVNPNVGVVMYELERYYSRSRNDYKLERASYPVGNRSSYYDDYERNGIIGWMFFDQQPGTCPLMEYYSDYYKNSFYTLNDVVDPGTFTYIWTLGYVYPGKLLDTNKVPFSIRTNISYNSMDPRYNQGAIIKYYIKTRERDTYYENVYSHNYGFGTGSKTITLPNTHAIVNVTIEIDFSNGTSSNGKFYIYNAFKPGNADSQNYPYYSMNRTLNGYETIFNFGLRGNTN